MKALAILFISGVVSAGGCFASSIFGTAAPTAGTRTENAGQIQTGGVYATDQTDLTLTWSIIANAGNPSLYDYTYVFSGYSSPAISHFLLSLSEGCSADPACITGSHDITFGVFSSTSNGNSNLNMPGTIDGAKFNFGLADSTTYAFTSDRSPVYGDFYIKGGQSTAWNVGLADHSSELATSFIARPDTSGAAVITAETPEPGTLFLLGGGVVFLLFGRKKLKKEINPAS